MEGLIFPVWMWYFAPTGWVHVLVYTFFVNAIFLSMTGFAVQDQYEGREIFRASIKRVYPIRLVSDIIGAFTVFLSVLISAFVPQDSYFVQVFVEEMVRSPFSSLPAFLWVTAGIFVAGAVSRALYKKFCFKDLKITGEERMKLIRWLSILSAPFWFYLTEHALYRFFTMQFIGG